MGEEDLTLEAFAEKVPDSIGGVWLLPVQFKGKCLIGCESAGLLTTKNMDKAMMWPTYHRSTDEHKRRMEEKRNV